MPDNSAQYRQLDMPFAEYYALLPEDEKRKRVGDATYQADKDGRKKVTSYVQPLQIKRMGEFKTRSQEQFNVNLNPHNFIDIYAPVSQIEINALRRYTCGEDGIYSQINRYMAAGQNVPRNTYLDDLIEKINLALSKSTLKQDIVVYRGMNDKKLFDLLKNGLDTIVKDYPNLHEKDIEEGLINNLQSFLLELGKGFCLVARRKRIRFEEQDFYIILKSSRLKSSEAVKT